MGPANKRELLSRGKNQFRNVADDKKKTLLFNITILQLCYFVKMFDPTFPLKGHRRARCGVHHGQAAGLSQG